MSRHGDEEAVLEGRTGFANPGVLKLRPEVAAFAQVMEFKLRCNDDKGGWKHCDPHWLLTRCWDEYRELCDAVRAGNRPGSVRQEAADLANFAMMVADVAGQLTGLPSKNPGEPR